MIPNDSQSYAKAAATGIAGVIVQTCLAVGLGLLGLYAGADDAILAAAYAAAFGIPAWLVIQIYLGQLRKERTELLETRALEGRAEAGGMFEEASLAEVRRRIERLGKWAFPGVALGLALGQMALGAWLVRKAWQSLLPRSDADLAAAMRRLLDGSAEAAPVKPAIVLFGLGVAVLLAFFLARYVAGMTKRKEWQILRGGAAALLATCALGALAALAFALAAFGGFPKAGAYAAVLIPGLVFVLGAETLLVLLVGLYRPRRAGEQLRPAFDSRLLGWLCGPESLGRLLTETLRYQFGLEISSSWFYRLLAKAGLPLAGLAAALVLGASCVFIVSPHEQAAVVTCGKLNAIRGPGIYLKAPWPLARVRACPVGRVQRLVVSGHPFDTESQREEKQAREDKARLAGDPVVMEPVLWNRREEKGRKEELLVTAADGTRSGEVLAADIALLYRIDEKNLAAYLTATDDPVRALETRAKRAVALYFATHTADALLGDGRKTAADALKAQIAADAPPSETGLEVLEVSLAGLRPPHEATPAFLDKVNARQEAQMQLHRAAREREQMLTAAAGSPEKAAELAQAIEACAQAQKTGGKEGDAKAADARVRVEALMERAGGIAADRLHTARADRWSQTSDESGKAKRFEALLAAYHAAPDYFEKRQLLDSLVATMANRPKMVMDKKDGETSTGQIRLQLQDSAGAGDILGGK